MIDFVVKAYAKINTFLAVGDLRPDGFHEIKTIMHGISLHDMIYVSEATNTSIKCSLEGLAGDQNLVSKAMRLLQELVEIPNFEIYIEKNIPPQSGLGGASSNVAFLLRKLHQLMPDLLKWDFLLDIAMACSSDALFFMGSTPRAKVYGRGDRIEPLIPLRPQSVVIAKPEVGVSSKEAYAKLDWRNEVRSCEWPADLNSIRNDFESVAPPASRDLIERLESLGAMNVTLTGSGSAVVGFTKNSSHSNGIVKMLLSEGAWAVNAQTLEAWDD